MYVQYNMYTGHIKKWSDEEFIRPFLINKSTENVVSTRAIYEKGCNYNLNTPIDAFSALSF